MMGLIKEPAQQHHIVAGPEPGRVLQRLGTRQLLTDINGESSNIVEDSSTVLLRPYYRSEEEEVEQKTFHKARLT